MIWRNISRIIKLDTIMSNEKVEGAKPVDKAMLDHVEIKMAVDVVAETETFWSNLTRIKESFDTLVVRVVKKLERNDINIKEFRMYIINLFPPGDIFTNAFSIANIFEAISQHQLWNYTHYAPIVEISKKFGGDDTELTKWIRDYELELTRFNTTSKITDYISKNEEETAEEEESLQQGLARYDKRYCKKLMVKLKERIIKDSCLDYIDQLWRSIAKYYFLPSPSALLDSIHKGCKVTWYVPTPSALQIQASIPDSAEFLQQQEIMQVLLDNEILYDEVGMDEVDMGMEEVCGMILWDKELTLLEYSGKKSLTPSLLVKIIDYQKNKAEGRESFDINSVDTEGYAAIHYIVANTTHEEKWKLLEILTIAETADVDLATNSGFTALHLAVKSNDLECVQTLISLGADVNIADPQGMTPLLVNIIKSKDYIQNQGIQLSTALDYGTLVNKNESSTRSPNVEEQKKTSRKIRDLLESVGACKERRGLSRKELEEVSYHSNYDPAAYKKINTMWYRETHDQIRESLSVDLNPNRALNLVKSMKQYEEYRRVCGSRILCLDGGGIRGLLQMTILMEIEKLTGRKIVDLFDWIVGTSTGGIIALALTYGPRGVDRRVNRKDVRQLRDIYWNMKDDIFGKSQDEFLGFLAKGNTKKLEELLQTWLGSDVTLDATTYPKVLIPAVYKKDTNLEVHFFNNCFDDDYSKEFVWKVGRYTSAAPLHFKEFENYIDGGMLVNNPSEAALTVIQDYYHMNEKKLPISLLVSVGSGINPGKPLGKIDVRANLFKPKVYFNLMEVMGSAVVSKQTDPSCRSRCRDQGIEYFRFDPELEEKVDSAQHESKKLLKMILTTRKYLNDHKDDMDRLVRLLKESELTST